MDQALKTILAGTGFTYTVKDTYIMIIPEQTAKKSKSRNVVGNVVDGKGAPLIGVTVVEKGTGNGTVTNMEGNYHITTQGATPVLVFSYIGYQSKEIVEKALSYNVQTVSNSELTVAKDANFMNSLNGKVAGVNIQKSSSGVGGATRVIMRGSKSIVGNNNALYVVDGMPIGNPSRGVIQTEYGAVAGSESISDFNPDDIESISVLTGPSAAALYGAAAANGVILINTKKGSEGKMKINFSSNTEFSKPMISPEFQNSYGNRDNSYRSWGEKLATPSSFDPMDFFKTGMNTINSLNISSGTKTNQTFISLASTNSKGVIKNNEY